MITTVQSAVKIFPIFDDDDEYTIQYREYLENSSNAITPDLPTEEPDNSLSMEDEHLSTIPETESEEVIKSSVEDLVPIPSESRIFSDFNDDCTSSDDDSFENIDYVEASPPDSELVSLDILHEKLLNINLLIACDLPSSDDFSPIKASMCVEDSYDSILDESTLLVTPLSDSNEDECLTPVDEIEFLPHPDPSISIVSILEGFTDEPPLEENDDLFDLESKGNEWKMILYDAPIMM
ncbi:hypothetical protein Tco_0588761 [Tanacetum coccineum]